MFRIVRTLIEASSGVLGGGGIARDRYWYLGWCLILLEAGYCVSGGGGIARDSYGCVG